MVAKSDMLRRAYAVKNADDIRHLYRDWAETYDEDLTGQDLQYVAPQEAVRVFGCNFADRSAHILDVGCGTGLSGVALVDAGYDQIDGIDLSPEMLEQARAKGVYGQLFEADLTAGLDFSDNSYDAAISVGTFTHGHVGPSGLDEVIRVVKPRGTVCVTINEGVFEKMKYREKIDQLEADGICRVNELVAADYLVAEDIGAMVLSLEVR